MLPKKIAIARPTSDGSLHITIGPLGEGSVDFDKISPKWKSAARRVTQLRGKILSRMYNLECLADAVIAEFLFPGQGGKAYMLDKDGMTPQRRLFETFFLMSEMRTSSKLNLVGKILTALQVADASHLSGDLAAASKIRNSFAHHPVSFRAVNKAGVEIYLHDNKGSAQKLTTGTISGYLKTFDRCIEGVREVNQNQLKAVQSDAIEEKEDEG
jgi:hypothetical protein